MEPYLKGVNVPMTINDKVKVISLNQIGVIVRLNVTTSKGHGHVVRLENHNTHVIIPEHDLERIK